MGPYHRARLEAAYPLLRAEGIRLAVLETASADAAYAWEAARDSTLFERHTVFRGDVFERIASQRMFAGVTSALDRLNPEVVAIHSYSMPDAWACLAWCRRNRRTALLMNDSAEADAQRTPWREQLKRVLVSQYDAALVAGRPQQRYHAGLGLPESRIFSGYDVVDNDYFARGAAAVRDDPRPARQLPGLADETPFFLASARFMERKDLPTLLQSYGQYRDQTEQPWRLVLLGDGALRPALEAFIRAEQIVGVSLPGWQPLEDLPAYYGLASAFVHTAAVDQWGLVVNEAMASGLPVIVSTGTGCHEDLVESGGNGFVFMPGDVTTLTRHLYAVAHEADRDALGRRSREIIARWPLELFGAGLLQATAAGAATSNRGLGTAARLLLMALLALSRTPYSFHTVTR